MTAVVDSDRRRWRTRRAERSTVEELEPLSPGLRLLRAVLVMVFILSLSLMLELLVVGVLQQRSSQQKLFDRFRAELALGTAPTGPVDKDGKAVPVGVPMAYLEIPAIGVRQVVINGTTSSNLFNCPGLRRDSSLPGQQGGTVIMGRAAAFGGPFAQLESLQAGDKIKATTGQGEFEYEVIDVRHENEPVPAPPPAGSARLVLATADGRPYLPEGVVLVDADLTSGAVTGPGPLFSSSTLPRAERFMASDTSTVWALVLWLQTLILTVFGAVWAWHRWGRAKAWIAFFPPMLLFGLLVANEAARLLPNMI